MDRMNEEKAKIIYNADETAVVNKADVETVLNMLEEKDKEIKYYTTQRKYDENFKHELLEEIRCKSLEIDRLNEIIDEMAEQLAGLTIYESVDNMVVLSDKKEEVIKYFERKVENEN